MNYRRAVVVTCVLLCAGACSSREADEVEANKRLVLRSHEEVWSQGKLELVEELYSTDFVCHFLIGPEWRGPDGVREHVSSHRVSFPDWTEEIEDLFAEGDKVVARFRASGTNLGSFGGNPPTGRAVSISEVAIYRIADGKIAEQWGFPDLLGMHRQLGLTELPGTPAP
jgi:steroid delta-isomerase-like uncharacterized protein